MKIDRILALSAVLLVAAACSSKSSTPQTAPAPAPSAPSGGAAAGGAAAGGDTVVMNDVLVNVINNRIPPSKITVYIVGPSIGRMLLGDVNIGETKAFTAKVGNMNGYFRLVAQAAGGAAEIPSQNFNLTPKLRFVQWSMDVNAIVQYPTPQ